MRFGFVPIRRLAAASLLVLVGLAHPGSAGAASCAGRYAVGAGDRFAHCIAQGVAELEAAVSIVDELFADGGIDDNATPYVFEGGRYDPDGGAVFFHRYDGRSGRFVTPRADTLPQALLTEESFGPYASVGFGGVGGAAPLGAFVPGRAGGTKAGPDVIAAIGDTPGSRPIVPPGVSPGGGSPGPGSANPDSADPTAPTRGPANPDAPTALTPATPVAVTAVPLPASVWLALAAVAGVGLVARTRRA